MAYSGTRPVLVADELLLPAGPAVPCPAGVLVAGELARRGIPTIPGPLHHPPDPSALSVVLPGGGAGRVGLGVAAERGDAAGGRAARAAFDGWRAAARPRTGPLGSPPALCAGGGGGGGGGGQAPRRQNRP